MVPSDKKAGIAAVILAAGESQRMGTTKALLKIGKISFIRCIVKAFQASDAERVIVVLGAASDEVKQEIADLDITVVVNSDYKQGQLSSILAGISAAEQFGTEAVFLHPVDHPWVTPQTINQLIAAFRASRSPVVTPVYNGKRGHPVLFAADLFSELKNAPSEIGARFVVWSHQADVREVETHDGGVILNVNTPEDYEHLQRNLRRSS